VIPAGCVYIMLPAMVGTESVVQGGDERIAMVATVGSCC
jgi:hypothetical protein